MSVFREDLAGSAFGSGAEAIKEIYEMLKSPEYEWEYNNNEVFRQIYKVKVNPYAMMVLQAWLNENAEPVGNNTYRLSLGNGRYLDVQLDKNSDTVYVYEVLKCEYLNNFLGCK